jgi:hypothetical protein
MIINDDPHMVANTQRSNQAIIVLLWAVVVVDVVFTFMAN